MHCRSDVAVEIDGHADLGMAKHLGDDLGMDAYSARAWFTPTL
jgi:hypothetical protein